MKLNLSVEWDVEDADAEVKSQLEEIIGEEGRTFIESVRRRLASVGVTDIQMNVHES